MTRRPPTDDEGRVVLPLDAEEALRALLKVDPRSPPAAASPGAAGAAAQADGSGLMTRRSSSQSALFDPGPGPGPELAGAEIPPRFGEWLEARRQEHLRLAELARTQKRREHHLGIAQGLRMAEEYVSLATRRPGSPPVLGRPWPHVRRPGG